MIDLCALWGKTVEGDPRAYHPAMYHMLDAGHVAQVMLSDGAPPGWRTALARTLGCDPETVRAAVPWFVALHDVGKCSQAFQEMVPPQKERLAALGVPFSARSMSTLPHTLVGAGAWRTLQAGPLQSLPGSLSAVLQQVIAGHHGWWLKAGQATHAGRLMAAREPRFWSEARAAAVTWLRDRLSVAMLPDGALDVSAAIMALSGFTILCDWLASDERHFPASADVSAADYVLVSQQRALEAVERAGFLQPTSGHAPAAFAALFTDIPTPRPLQEAVDAVPTELLSEPALAFIEAPTGEGKTEAALALAHRIGVLRGTDALYYALPTMATSNAMFARVNHHLAERLGLSARSRLVHGQAFLLQDDHEPRPLKNGLDDEHPMVSWFSPLKKALLAPFGVGTIDQVELAALNVRHVALRCAGLAGKVVILDEVHAYDVYMTTIIERLLAWLRAMGASVIVLSATLPLARRRALRAAWAQDAPDDREEGSYPRLEVISSAGRHVSSPLAYQAQRTIGLRWLDLPNDAADAQAAWLLEQVQHGGCACWIANTVAAAQALYRALRGQAPGDLPLYLLHSRFPAARREHLEAEVMRRYGPESPDDRRGIVVGTQVLEQSLDLDFDLMVSDLAPADLLLQRAGRLHRHYRPRRPMANATLWVNVAWQADGTPDLDASAAVYDEYILRRTLKALGGRDMLRLPHDYRSLIEETYAEGVPADADLLPSWEAYRRANSAARDEAEQRLLPAPQAEGIFCTTAAELHFQEDEDSASWGVAQTRLGAESVTLVPLERRGRHAWLRSADLTLALDEPCDRATALTVLRHAIRVSHRGVLRALEGEAVPDTALFRHPLLRRVRPLWLVDGHGRLGDRGEIGLTDDPELGLVID